MKNKALIAGILIAILNGLLFVPGFEVYGTYMVAMALALALWLVLKALTVPDLLPSVEAAEPVRAAESSVAPPAPKNAAEAEVIAVISALQNKGRLVDFLMDDISKYSDAQVGAAARVVHQGCKGAFGEMFTVEPVVKAAEGSKIDVPPNGGELYRLSGSVSGEGPHSGVLVHKGWRVSNVNLPRVLKVEEGKLPPIAPAQVEVK